MFDEANLENELLEQAIGAVYREAGLRLKIDKKEVKIDERYVDAIIHIQGDDQPIAVEIKKWVPQANVGVLINQIKNLPIEGILVADYVNPKMAEQLRDNDVQFVDTAGNAYINKPPTYVYVKGNRQGDKLFTTKKETTQRAFGPTGLKVVYVYLCKPELVNAPYREIADEADVALGTVGWVINDLKATGFIIDKGGKRGRRLANYRKLLDRWVEAYPEKLRPKQWAGDFLAENPYWWKEIDIQKYHAYWGGEIAAAKYTKYLKPEIATVYLPDKARKQLLLDGRLRKQYATEGPVAVKIYRPFWRLKENNTDCVHPVLVYADLIATGDVRNLETAKLIYDEYIAKYCRED